MSSAMLAYPRYTEASWGSTEASDRRRSPRWAVSGQATAVVCSLDARESRYRICPLQLLNISDTGVGVISDDGIAPGAQISVFVMPDGAEAGYDLRGTVVRCDARTDRGHSVGIRLARRCAA